MSGPELIFGVWFVASAVIVWVMWQIIQAMRGNKPSDRYPPWRYIDEGK